MNNTAILILAILPAWVPILSANPRVVEIVKKDVAGKILHRGIARMDADGLARSYRVYEPTGKCLKRILMKYSAGKKAPRAVRAVIHGPTGSIEGYVIKTKGGFDILTPKSKLKKHFPDGDTDDFGIIDFCIKGNMVEKNPA